MSLNPRICTVEDLVSLRDTWSREGKTVVWTNGCFDLVHAGHLRSLNDAKSLGDILIVGLNSDESVRAIKGSGRPLINERERAELMAGLRPVDYVTIFHEPDPISVLSRLKPDIHCKGAEYADGKRPMPEKAVVEAYGGQIRFLPYHAGLSTSSLIESITKIGKERSTV